MCNDPLGLDPTRRQRDRDAALGMPHRLRRAPASRAIGAARPFLPSSRWAPCAHRRTVPPLRLLPSARFRVVRARRRISPSASGTRTNVRHSRIPDEQGLPKVHFTRSLVLIRDRWGRCRTTSRSHPAASAIWTPRVAGLVEARDAMCFATRLPSRPAPRTSMELNECRKGIPTKYRPGTDCTAPRF